MITNEDREYTLREFLRTIMHISDLEYQKRIWIRGEGPEVDDFDETVCYFSDISELILEEYKEYEITESQYQILQKFQEEFEAFANENDFPWEFIDTPEWDKIVNMAKEVLEAFHYKKSAG